MSGARGAERRDLLPVGGWGGGDFQVQGKMPSEEVVPAGEGNILPKARGTTVRKKGSIYGARKYEGQWTECHREWVYELRSG